MPHLRSFSSLVGLLLLLACAKQGEGDRCLRANGNRDCDDGLVCWPADDLAESAKQLDTATDRCCREDGTSRDPRCAVRTSADEGEAGAPAEGSGESTPASSARAGASDGGAAGASAGNPSESGAAGSSSLGSSGSPG